jgi:hypothetical protein
MKKIIKLTEQDLVRIVRRVIKETDKEKIIQGIVNGKLGNSKPLVSERITRNKEYYESNYFRGSDLTFKVGDIYKVTRLDGSHVRFKINKVKFDYKDKIDPIKYPDFFDVQAYIDGIVLGIFGKYKPDKTGGYPPAGGFREPKIGDPVRIYVTSTPGKRVMTHLPYTNKGYDEGGDDYRNISNTLTKLS